jgi:hypothetical protein
MNQCDTEMEASIPSRSMALPSLSSQCALPQGRNDDGIDWYPAWNSDTARMTRHSGEGMWLAHPQPNSLTPACQNISQTSSDRNHLPARQNACYRVLVCLLFGGKESSVARCVSPSVRSFFPKRERSRMVDRYTASDDALVI